MSTLPTTELPEAETEDKPPVEVVSVFDHSAP